MTTGKVGSGSTALKGYFFQRDVTVLLGLRLIILNQTANFITVEPWTEEDVEAEIDESQTQPGLSIGTGSYKLSIQIKKRTTTEWNVNSFKRLIAHGKERPSAIKQLEDPNIRFLLVTDAEVVGEAKHLKIKTVGNWPNKIPKSIKSIAKLDNSSRIGIIARLDEERINNRIKNYLTESLKVPFREWNNCYEALRRHTFQLMTEGGGLLEKSDILGIVTSHGGYTGAFAVTASFVPPSNFNEIKEKLATHNAVVIVGPTGTGKTTLAKVLVDEVLSNTKGPICHESVISGPAQVQNYSDTGAVVFDIEDPWGKYSDSMTAGEWSAILPEMLRKSDSDVKFIITSRADFFTKNDQGKLNRWVTKLEQKHYGRASRAQMYNFRLDMLPPDLQDLAHVSRDIPLRELETPLEIEKYFVNLIEGSWDADTKTKFVLECTQKAKDEVIEDSVVKQVVAQNAQLEAGIIWGLLQAFPSLNRSFVQEILWDLDDRYEGIGDKTEALIDRLISTFTLRLKEGNVSYRHNRDEKGLRESFASQYREVSKKLSTLLSLLVGSRAEVSWRAGINLAEAIENDDNLRLRLNNIQKSQLNDRLLQAVIASDVKFVSSNFKRLANLSSHDFIPGQLASWLTHTEINNKSEGSFPWPDKWKPMDVTEEFISRIKSNEHSSELIEKFIKEILIEERWSDYRGFAKLAFKMHPDIGKTFRNVCEKNLNDMSPDICGAIIEGCLIEFEQSEELFMSSQKTLEKLNSTPMDDNVMWSLVNNEYSEDYEQHAGEGDYWERQGHVQFIEKYIERARTQDAAAKLSKNIIVEDAVVIWLNQARHFESKKVEEWNTLLNLSRRFKLESRFWSLLPPNMDTSFLEKSIELMTYVDDAKIRHSAAIYWSKCGAPDAERHLKKIRSEKGFSILSEWILEMRCQHLKKDGTDLSDDLVSLLDEAERDTIKLLAGYDLSGYQLDIKSILLLLEQLSKDISRDTLALVIIALSKIGENTCDDIVKYIEAEIAPNYDARSRLEKVVNLIDREKCPAAITAALESRHSLANSLAISKIAMGARQFPDFLLRFAKSESRDILDSLLEFVDKIGAKNCTDLLMELVMNEAQANYHGPDEVAFPYSHKAADRLSEATVPINQKNRTALIKHGKKSEDFDLSQKLFSIAIAKGGVEETMKVFEVVRDSDRNSNLGIVASIAVLQSKNLPNSNDLIYKDVLEVIGKKQPKTAVLMSYFVGAILDDLKLEKLSEKLKAANNHSPLLIPLAYGSYEKDSKGNWKTPINRIPITLRKKTEKAITGKMKLSPSDLNGYGHISIRKALVDLAGDTLFKTMKKS